MRKCCVKIDPKYPEHVAVYINECGIQTTDTLIYADYGVEYLWSLHLSTDEFGVTRVQMDSADTPSPDNLPVAADKLKPGQYGPFTVKVEGDVISISFSQGENIF